MFGAFLLACISPAYAHGVVPTGVKTVKVGQTFNVSVLPSGADDHCRVVAKASVQSGSSFVTIKGKTKKKAKSPAFTFEARAPGTAVIRIDFDGVGKKCPAVSHGNLTVTVEPKTPPGPQEYATTTILDFTKKKGKDVGKAYGVTWSLNGVEARSGTWLDDGTKNPSVLFKAGNETGSGYGLTPGMMIGMGRVQGRFGVDPMHTDGVLPTTSAGVRATRAGSAAFWGTAVRWGDGTVEVFSQAGGGEGNSVTLSGTSVEVAVEFVDGFVSFQHRADGAESWTEFDRVVISDLPDDVIFSFTVNGLGPGGQVYVDDVVTKGSFMGPAEKAICAMLEEAITMEEEALTQFRDGGLIHALTWLDDAINQIDATIQMIRDATVGSGIENPDDPQGPNVKANPDTKTGKVLKRLDQARKHDKKAFKEIQKAKPDPKVVEKALKAALEQKLLANSLLHGLKIGKGKDLPEPWRR